MQTDKELKEMVRQKYTEIASQTKSTNESSCCGSGCCTTEVYNIMTDDYSQMDGYEPAADLGLGCGLPTQFAKIEKGNIVVDLGSGAGNDCFIARSETGEDGRIVGVDFTEAMISKANINREKLGFDNVEFRFGEIENLPIDNDFADVVISNCVLNLVPNKNNVFKEIYRVLKPGGHFSISDIVLVGGLPYKLKSEAEMYAGCVAGAIQKEEYLSLIENNGFSGITIQKEKVIAIPDDILSKYLDQQMINEFKSGATGIFSITVFAKKPLSIKTNCCAPGCCD